MPKESRSYPRIPEGFTVQYRISGEFTQTWHSARSVNISASGIRLLAEPFVEKGDELEIQLNLPGLRNPLVLMGRVVWEKAIDDWVECGIEFLEMSADQRMQIDALVEFMRQHGRSTQPPATS